ncbi:hypothetical protein MTP03_25640 [Tsukamurella sp. PLM1]|nr:hypothetical protein MTP03_25640 [Tsukamurella sp. PLM1]
MTVHGSKGLQFPVVYLPFAWDSFGGFGDRDTFTFHEDGVRYVDVGGKDAPGYAARLTVSREEEAAEELRLLYVGATRAQSRLVLWWAPSTTTKGSPLHRLLFSAVGGGRVPDAAAPLPPDAEVGARLREWAAPIESAVSIEPVDLAAPPPRSGTRRSRASRRWSSAARCGGWTPRGAVPATRHWSRTRRTVPRTPRPTRGASRRNRSPPTSPSTNRWARRPRRAAHRRA